jgi:hypothetical protein
VREFEGSGQVGLDLVGGPNALHARRRYPGLPSHRKTPPGPPP